MNRLAQFKRFLKSLRTSNADKHAHLDINSIRTKLQMLSDQIKDNTDAMIPANICWSSRRLQHVFSVTILRLP